MNNPILFKKELSLSPEQIQYFWRGFRKMYEPMLLALPKTTVSLVRYAVSENKAVNCICVQPMSDTPLPCIIHHTGGVPLSRNTLVRKYDAFFTSSLIFQNRYIVFYLRYEDEETGLEDTMGGEDLLATYGIEDVIRQWDGADINRVGMYGVSRGVKTSLLTLPHLSLVKTAFCMSGAYTTEGVFDREEKFQRMQGYDIYDQKEKDKRNPTKHIDALPTNMPICMIHGTEDVNTPVTYARAFYEKYGKINPHLVYNEYEDDHYFRGRKKKSREETFKWFEKHL